MIEKLCGGKELIAALSIKGYECTPENLYRLESALDWLDLKTPVSPRAESVMDAFCALLQDKLVYEEGERDMVAMHHEFGIKWKDGKVEKKTSTMIAYGDPNGYSAMAKTVGFPAAIAVDMILKGEIKQVGVVAPINREIYNPIIDVLHNEGIKFVEASHLI